MELNAKLLERAVVDSTQRPWVASPAHGIERRLLERDGDEVARATSIVRYLPGSHFGAHLHGLGEEIYVLEGELRDEHGRYPTGTWIKNPAGSVHAPFTDTGCLLFVKLRHLDPEDQERVVIQAAGGRWSAGRAPGVERMRFGRYGDAETGLARFAPGARSARHDHPGGEEVLVLEGSYQDEFGRYTRGTWIRSPHGSSHLPRSEAGCLLFIKTGHLPTLPAAAPDARE